LADFVQVAFTIYGSCCPASGAINAARCASSSRGVASIGDVRYGSFLRVGTPADERTVRTSGLRTDPNA